MKWRKEFFLYICVLSKLLSTMPDHFYGVQKDWSTILKRQIIHLFFKDGIQTIADMSRKILSSIPTTTKFINELMAAGFVIEKGKANTEGGRKPTLYAVNPDAGYFVGADLRSSYANIAIIDFAGNQVSFTGDIPFQLRASTKSGKELMAIIKEVVSEAGIAWESILHIGISVAGPTDPVIGRNMYYYVSKEKPFSQYMSMIMEVPVVLENVSRSKIAAEVRYGEHVSKDMLYLNLDEEFGMSYLVKGQIVYGHNGFAGNAGHATIPGNPYKCRCGKTGCLTTVSSCEALLRFYLDALKKGEKGELSEKYQAGEEFTYKDALDALKHSDPIALNCCREIGKNLLKIIGITVNMSSPNIIIVGGQLASSNGEEVVKTIREGLNASLDKDMYGDVEVHLCSVKEPAASLGACIMAQRHYIGLE